MRAFPASAGRAEGRARGPGQGHRSASAVLLCEPVRSLEACAVAPGLLLGFAALSEPRSRAGLDVLGKVLRSQR
ncbi:hypothetical protein LP420_15790 [Massilia sp. B-10]|nr:hypothetical protein LP420_15790 [Massilia sp. B-10]